MVLYDLVVISRRNVKQGQEIVKDIKNLMKSTALQVMDAGGVVRGFQVSQQSWLPYKMRRHQQLFEEGYTWGMQMDASPSAVAKVRKALAFDERVIRSSVIKMGDSLGRVSGVSARNGVATGEYRA